MKIPKPVEGVNRVNFITKLKAEGYEKLGSGAYATVYGRKDGTGDVVKVGRLNYNYENNKCGYTDGYMHYLKVMPRRNRHVPAIRSVVITKSKTGKLWYAVTMERLVEFEHGDCLSETPFGPDGLDDLGTLRFSSKDKHAQKLSDIIRNHGVVAGSNYCSDVAEQNVMWRVKGKKRTLVITDPLC